METSTTTQDEDQSKRVIEDVEAGQSDVLVGNGIFQKPA